MCSAGKQARPLHRGCDQGALQRGILLEVYAIASVGDLDAGLVGRR